MINEELAEGVYAASGCWHLTSKSVKQNPQKGRNSFVVDIKFWHDDVAHQPNAYMTIAFSEPVMIDEDLCSYEQVDGGVGYSYTIKLKRTQPINAGKEEWGFGDLYVLTEKELDELTIIDIDVVDGGAF